MSTVNIDANNVTNHADYHPTILEYFFNIIPCLEKVIRAVANVLGFLKKLESYLEGHRTLEADRICKLNLAKQTKQAASATKVDSVAQETHSQKTEIVENLFHTPPSSPITLTGASAPLQ